MKRVVAVLLVVAMAVFAVRVLVLDEARPELAGTSDTVGEDGAVAPSEAELAAPRDAVLRADVSPTASDLRARVDRIPSFQGDAVLGVVPIALNDDGTFRFDELELGTFEVSVVGRAEMAVEPLAPLVHADVHAGETTRIDDIDGPRTVVLGPGLPVNVRLLDPTVLASDVAVTVRLRSGRGAINAVLGEISSSATVELDAEGRAVVIAPAEWTYTVVVSLRLRSGGPSQRIAFEPPLTVEVAEQLGAPFVDVPLTREQVDAARAVR